MEGRGDSEEGDRWKEEEIRKKEIDGRKKSFGRRR